MIGYLYIVHNYEMYGWNTFKIGLTNDLKRRLEDFNSNTINILQNGVLILRLIVLLCMNP